jgi:Lon protease-like protein
MHKVLPARPSLEHLKSQAKDLLDAYRRGEPAALKRFREALPAAHGADDAGLVAMKLALHDAQSAIAREYGFASWNELRMRVEANVSPEAIRALMERHLTTPMPSEVQQALVAAAGAPDSDVLSLDTPLPMVPIRNALLAAGAVAPFNVGRPASIAAVEAASSGAKALAMFTQTTATNDAPGAKDLHPIGCAVRLLSVIRTPDQGLWIIVKAVRWVRLADIERTDPFLVARVSEFVIEEEIDEEVTRMHRLLLERVRAAITALPDSARMLEMVKARSPSKLADSTLANLPCSVDDKARYAAQSKLKERLRLVLALMSSSPA